MTQEEKQLLLKDLCARLPYHPFFKRKDDIMPLYNINTYVGVIDCIPSIKIEDCRLYLRPMSSMTEEEMDKLFDILHIDKDGRDDDWIKINDDLGIKFFFPTGKWIENVAEAYDYLNSIHIDYRGLIPMGLALEAHEDMYE